MAVESCEVKKSFLPSFVALCSVAVLGVGACKKNTPSANHDHELKKLAADKTFYELSVKTQQSMKPGDFVITFDDGPMIKSPGACDERVAVDEDSSVSAQKTEGDLPKDFDKSAVVDTAGLVDFLISEKIPATFFVVGLEYRKSKNAQCVVDRMVASEHLLLANHTWSHISSFVEPKKCNTSTTKLVSPHKHPHALVPAGGDPDAYSKFLRAEVKAAHCLIHERLQKVLSSEPEKIRNYPLFFRPPGGYWEDEDRKLLVQETALDAYIGPVPWNFGGGLLENHAADYACWERDRWWRGLSEAQRQKEWDLDKGREEEQRKMPLFLWERLEKGMSMEQACSELYMQSIMSRPPENRKGIILMHDNVTRSVRMFVNYLYPALKKQGFQLISLSDVPYYKKQLEEIRVQDTVFSDLPFLKSPCAFPLNYCTCCSSLDQSCCNGARPPPLQ